MNHCTRHENPICSKQKCFDLSPNRAFEPTKGNNMAETPSTPASKPTEPEPQTVAPEPETSVPATTAPKDFLVPNQHLIEQVIDARLAAHAAHEAPKKSSRSTSK